MFELPVRRPRDPFDTERSRGHRHVGGPVGQGPRERHFIIAATVAAIVAAMASAYAAYSASQNAAAQQRYQAKVAKNQATNAQNLAQVESERRRDLYARQMASQRAAIGSAGVQANEGSPLLLQIDAAEQAALDIANVKYQGEIASTNYRSEAVLHKFAAKNTEKQGYVQAGASLLQGAAKAYGIYSSGGMSGAA